MESIDAAKSAILERVSIVDVIGSVVELQNRSGLKVGRCPFHEENTASFSVYPDHYYCFGCKEHGDIISFVRKTQGLGFVDALRYLAPRAGLDPAQLDFRQDKAKRSREAGLYKALLAAQGIFKDHLHQPRNQRTIEYLRRRGFSDENITAFGFGQSLGEPRGLIDILHKQGIDETVLEACSLATRSQKNNRLYDFFRDRLTVPIHDQFGRMIGFGGRALADDQMPKYKNSRDSLLFDKSVTLYGFHRAKDAIRKGQPAIICEGYMDVLQLWQNELSGAVACMGTALKSAHLKKLSNLTNKVYLLLDGDQAGKQGSLSAITSALEVPKLEVYVASLPNGEDPDSFVREHGPEALKEILSTAPTLLDFGIRTKLSQAGDTSVPTLLREEILPWLLSESDHLRQAFLLNRVAQLTGISRAHLEEELELLTLNRKHSRRERQSAKRSTEPPAPSQRARTPLTNLEFEYFGHLFFADPSELDLPKIKEFVTQQLSIDELWSDLVNEMLQVLEVGQVPAEAERSLWVSTTDASALALIQTLDRQAQAFSVRDRTRRINRLEHEIKLKQHRTSITKLKSQMGSAGPEEQLSIIRAIQSINNSIKNLEDSLK